MRKYRKPTLYASQFTADTAALALSYQHGEEFFVCELYDQGYIIKGEVTVYSGVFDRDVYRSVRGTRLMGWYRGLHKELGDDSPVKIQCKVEVPRRSYTW